MIELQSAAQLPRFPGKKLAFVPTMGALHAGHAALIAHANSISDEVVVSCFINPTQFSDPQDLEKYPRTPDADKKVAREAGATYIWFPKVEEIYPSEPVVISAGALGNIFEGAARPGHFDGVATVVTRLFELIRPYLALFGEKDLQQLAVIRALDTSVKIVAVPTVRDSDGLALSSRNQRLSTTDREAALVISRALAAAAQAEDLTNARRVLNEVLKSEPLFSLDYAEVVDPLTFAIADENTENPRAVVAGLINGVRLIDNLEMKNPSALLASSIEVGA